MNWTKINIAANGNSWVQSFLCSTGGSSSISPNESRFQAAQTWVKCPQLVWFCLKEEWDQSHTCFIITKPAVFQELHTQSSTLCSPPSSDVNESLCECVQELVQDVSSEFSQDCSKASWVMSKYVIGHAHLHQSIWCFRFWLIIVFRACTPILVRFCAPGFQIDICGAPYGSGSKCFARPVPNDRMLFTNIYDDWTNG